MELSEGTLTPAFDKDTFSYTAAVGNEVEGVQVKAFFADGITAMLGEEALESGVYSEEIPLQVGENEIIVTLRLEGEESEYVIVVTREEEAVTEPDPNPGTDKPAFLDLMKIRQAAGTGIGRLAAEMIPPTDLVLATVTKRTRLLEITA